MQFKLFETTIDIISTSKAMRVYSYNGWSGL